MIKALTLPDRSFSLEQSINGMGRSTLEATEDFCEWREVSISVLKRLIDEMDVVRHDHGATEMYLGPMIVTTVLKHRRAHRFG